MSARFEAALPLAAAVALVAFVDVELSLNPTLHWVTSGGLGTGLHLPTSSAAPGAQADWVPWPSAG